MAKVALIWELGGDLGHLMPLTAIAKELMRREHQPILLTRDTTRVLSVVGDTSIPYLQSPLWEAKSYDDLPPAVNFADTLLRRGYLEPDALYSSVVAWDNTFAAIDAECLIFDHAPTAQLAARGIEVPKLLIGSSFSVLPRKSPFPRFAYWEKHNAHNKRLLDTEKRCVRTANEILNATGKPKISALCDLYDCDEQFIRTLPEFDVYGERDDATYVGPLLDHSLGETPRWPSSDGPKIFAYLKPHYKYLDFILTVLGRLNASVCAYVPSLPPQFIKKYQTGGVTFSTKPLALKSVASAADFAISHAGVGTTNVFAEAGVPQFLLPMQMEQTINSRRLADAGLGLYFPLHDPPQFLQKLFQQFFSDTTLKESANHWGAEHQALPNQVAMICNRIEHYL